MRQLLEEGVLAPHGLRHHLRQLHSTEGRREPPIATQHVHTRLDESNGLCGREGEGRDGGWEKRSREGRRGRGKEREARRQGGRGREREGGSV